MSNERSMLIDRTYANFDQMAEEARGWDFEFIKLDAGSFTGKVKQFIKPDLIASHSECTNRLQIAGVQPAGFRCFAIPAEPHATMLWRGQHVSGNNLLIFPSGGEQHAIGNKFNIYSFCVPEAKLLKLAERMKIGNFEDTLNKHEVITCDPHDLHRLISYSRNHCLSGKPPHPFQLHEIMSQLIQLIMQNENRKIPKISTNRRILIEATEDAIHSAPDNPPSIREICSSFGISARTLQYAFHEIYSVTPKFYINAVRLNAVYKALKQSTSTTRCISDIANEWGFWHMGQLAADYKKLFGELPSETLRRT